ncbi:MAG: hypothetical protein Q4E67_06855, partial [Planctomycetia bacterium]|nr:hypothetical protein [Planctomycetia bacterium]
SVPLKDWRLSGMEKKGLDLKFVKIALEVDGNRYEGWIRAQLPDPTFPEPAAAEWELISLPGKERTVTVSLAPDQVDLGFRLFLNRFHRRLDPGTSMAAHYSSEVSLLDRESEDVRQKNIRIHLNQPVDFADPQTHRIWRVYQSSFRGPILPNDPLFQKVVPAGDLREQLYISWFTVNHAPGRGLLYLGCLLMVLGMTLLGMRKIQGKKAGKEG